MSQSTVLAASAILGYGFDERSLELGLKRDPVVIGCDAGSTDQGPCDLGSGSMHMSKEAYARDLSLMIDLGRKAGVPVVVGTAGGAGIDAHVDTLAEIAHEVGSKGSRSPRIASVYSEVSTEWLQAKLRDGKIVKLDPSAPDLTAETIDSCVRIVAMMGAEPIQKAVQAGFEVVIAGRSSDTALFAAVPLLHGAGEGPAWHAGKILECGAAAAVPASAGDAMLVSIGQTSFIAEAPNPKRHCTPVSVAAHTLYENGDPFLLREPSGTLDTSLCAYSALDERRVLVEGSRFHKASEYTVRLEGAELIGYRSISLAGIRDTRLIAMIDDYLERVFSIVRDKVSSIHPSLAASDYTMDARLYGKDAVMGVAEPRRADEPPHELGVLLSVIAPTQELSHSVLGVLRAMTVHTDFPGQAGLCSNLAFPFSPSDIDLGAVYNFNLQHVVKLDDPLECFRFSWEMR